MLLNSSMWGLLGLKYARKNVWLENGDTTTKRPHIYPQSQQQCVFKTVHAMSRHHISLLGRNTEPFQIDVF